MSGRWEFFRMLRGALGMTVVGEGGNAALKRGAHFDKVLPDGPLPTHCGRMISAHEVPENKRRADDSTSARMLSAVLYGQAGDQRACWKPWLETELFDHLGEAKMKLREIKIHNYRSVIDVCIESHDYTLLVGANNAGKSTVLNALRAFYEDIKWTAEDFPKTGTTDAEAWVQLKFVLDDDEWAGLAEKYKDGAADQSLAVRRYFKSEEKGRVQANQSNIFGLVKGELDTELFYGAKNVGAAKVGQIVYVPALTTPGEQTKMSGPSPLRNMLNFLLKKVVAKSAAFKDVSAAFEKFNAEAKKDDGFLSEISAPLNVAISSWSIKIDLSVGSVTPEDISKSLVKFAFVDAALGDVGFDLERYGHGFQRSVIYELIRLAPTFKEEKKADKKEFSPSFNLVLFEEPEAFLHPSQQESMAYHLRRLGAEPGQQVIITTHSPTFAGKAAEQIGQLVRIQRANGASQAFQPKGGQINAIFDQGGALLAALQAFDLAREKRSP